MASPEAGSPFQLTPSSAPHVCLIGPSSPSVPTGASQSHMVPRYGPGTRELGRTLSYRGQALCALLGRTLQSRHAQDTHLAPVRPVTVLQPSAAPSPAGWRQNTLPAWSSAASVGREGPIRHSQSGSPLARGAPACSACSPPASHTLGPASVDRQFRLHTSGRLRA